MNNDKKTNKVQIANQNGPEDDVHCHDPGSLFSMYTKIM